MKMKTRKTEIERSVEKGSKLHSEREHPILGQVRLLERPSLLGDGSSFILFNSDGVQLLGMQEFPNPETAWKALR